MSIRKIDKNIGTVPSWGDNNFDENIHQNFLDLKEIVPAINNTVDDINNISTNIETNKEIAVNKAGESALSASSANQSKLDAQAARDTTLAAKSAVEAIGGIGLTSLTNGDTLEYDSVTSKFKNTNLHSKTSKTTLADADEMMLADSTSTFSLKKITWANIKAVLSSLFISKVTSTDNAIVRFDGTTGSVQNSGVIIDDNNNVGIGTSSPNAKTDIRFGALNSPTQLNHILLQSLSDNTNVAYGARTGITFNNRTVDYTNSGGFSTSGIYGVNTDNSAYGRSMGLSFYTSAIDVIAVERMRIDSSGNVGIGATPDNRLTILSDALAYGGEAYRSNITIYDSNTAAAGVGGGIGFGGYYNGTSNRTTFATINASKDNASSSDVGGSLIFKTRSSATNPVERMRIDSSGNLLLTSGTGALGYGAGAGGTVTQLTSKSTSVTLNKPSGNIITHNSALSAGQVAYIQLYNSLITVNDLVYATADFGAARYTILPYVYSSGGVTFSIKNEESVTRSDAVTIKFIVIKGANS